MTIGRIFGLLLILLSVVVLGRDSIASFNAGEINVVELGRLWFELHPASLNGLQAGLERYVSVWAWDTLVEPVLHWPAFIIPLVPGLLLVIFCKRRGEAHQSKRFFKRRH